MPKSLEGNAPETSAEIAARVLTARKIQESRFAGLGVHVNAEMSGDMLTRFCPLSDECAEIMERMSTQLSLSARAFSRVLKLSRTIADLENGPIQPRHILEAFSYRFLDRLAR